jgi:nucleoid-associated protein YgaU
MALSPIKVLLFLAGGSVAVGGTAYVAGVFDPFLKPQVPAVTDAAPEAQKLAALPPSEATVENPAAPADTNAPSVEVPKPPAGDAPAASPPPAPASETAPAATEQPAAELKPEPKVEAPAFDLVRVEADGSIVIAGRAAPNAKVEAIIGSRVIGSAIAGAGGDFAIVLDEPLKPGDYQIVLRSTTADNVVAMSTETAVVSIPDSSDGQVLALVEEPGKPSQLITMPEPKQANPSVTSAADSGPSTAGSTAQADANPPVASDNKPAADQQAVADSEASGKSSADAATTDQGAADTTAKQQPAPDAAAPEQKPTAGSEQQVAAATPDPAPAKPQQQPAGKTRVAVEAVEIEGRRIFVAGTADAGRVVRGYANEILLGDAKTSPAGRFLIEAERDLPVGDYIIRVDALGPDGAQVVARAAVPFEREAGENVAAVATPDEPRPAAPQPQPDAPPADEVVAKGTQPRLGKSDEAHPTATEAPAVEGAAQSAVAAAAPEKTAGSAPDKAAAQPAPAGQTETAAAPTETLSPKLENVGGSVIIRRGDSLWRISHRVYGRGLRYSTIYLANQHQIDDPDRIYPGQVFSVPSKTEKGEEADMTTLGEQAISPVVRQ